MFEHCSSIVRACEALPRTKLVAKFLTSDTKSVNAHKCSPNPLTSCLLCIFPALEHDAERAKWIVMYHDGVTCKHSSRSNDSKHSHASAASSSMLSIDWKFWWKLSRISSSPIFQSILNFGFDRSQSYLSQTNRLLMLQLSRPFDTWQTKKKLWGKFNFNFWHTFNPFANFSSQFSLGSNSIRRIRSFA